MRAIRKENHKLRIDQTAYDCGIEDIVQTEPELNRFVINGVDVLANLTGMKRVIFSLHIRGRSKGMMARMLRTPRAAAEGYDPNMLFSDACALVDQIITEQQAYLLANHKSALYYTPTRYDYYRLNDE